MSENALTTTDSRDLSFDGYGSRADIAVFAKRIKAMLPGGGKMTDTQAMALAQYSIAMGANPFRGEVYGYVDSHGQFVLVDGYKLLVRWAKRQCEFTERYIPLADLPDGAYGYRCHILRNDAMPMLEKFIVLGATFADAYETVSSSAVGVVSSAELTTRDGRSKPPPSGWTWDEVARKRALKNALNRAYGMPSPQEVARMSWELNGHDTIPADWETTTPQMSKAEREATAEYAATLREIDANPTCDSAAEAIDDLFGDFVENEQTPPNANEWIGDAKARAAFWAWTKEQGLTHEQVHVALGADSLKEWADTLENTKHAIQDWIDEQFEREDPDTDPLPM